MHDIAARALLAEHTGVVVQLAVYEVPSLHSQPHVGADTNQVRQIWGAFAGLPR